MVIIGNVGQIDKAAAGFSLDEVWLIVRSKKQFRNSCKFANVFHVPELSPSYGLFQDYLRWKGQGEWNREIFDFLYVPKFLEQMHEQSARDKLNLLYEKTIYEFKNIMLVCFCEDESLCHRSIVAGLMKGVGVATANVSGESIDYSEYYYAYCNQKR